MNLKHITVGEANQRREFRLIEPSRESSDYEASRLDRRAHGFHPQAVAAQFLLSSIEIELEL